ncbi:MAG: hypothetical protein FGM52_01630 [Mycobacterium sp.]|nr:hypothetical protein [Mycobacterium sp.]
MAGKKKDPHKLDAERRRREAAAARRDEHAKLVVERHGDPRYLQQRRTPTGRTIKWNRDSPEGKQLEVSLRQQRALFVEKFGREPGPGDPVFFDPTADEPTPLTAQAEVDMWDDMLAAAEDAGIDPALTHAARELGYLITDANRHLFSAIEVEAFREAVFGYRGEPDDDEDEGDVAYVAHGLQLVVAETLLSGGDEQPALRFVEGLLNGLEHDDGVTVALIFGCLMSWLAGVRERGIGGAAAVKWANEHLSEDAAAAALRASGLLGYPYAPDLTVSELHVELGPVAIAAMIWLAAGLVATAGGGDATWLRQFDPFS